MIESGGSLIWVGKIECTRETLVINWGGRAKRMYRRKLQRSPDIVGHVQDSRMINSCRDPTPNRRVVRDTSLVINREGWRCIELMNVRVNRV
jgi:hypothetical protein